MDNKQNIFEPANSKDLFAMPEGPLKSLYMTAFQTECKNLEEQKVYHWDILPPGRKATGSRAVFQLKWDKLTGELDKPKCRIVAQGFTQIPGIDFNETYASTPKLSTMRMFLWTSLSLGLIEVESKMAELFGSSGLCKY